METEIQTKKSFGKVKHNFCIKISLAVLKTELYHHQVFGVIKWMCLHLDQMDKANPNFYRQQGEMYKLQNEITQNHENVSF